MPYSVHSPSDESVDSGSVASSSGPPLSTICPKLGGFPTADSLFGQQTETKTATEEQQEQSAVDTRFPAEQEVCDTYCEQTAAGDCTGRLTDLGLVIMERVTNKDEDTWVSLHVARTL